MSEVTKYIQKLSNKTPEHEELKLAVSVRINAETAFKLEILGQKYGLKKTTFATDILVSAVEDAWEAAEQEPLEKSGDLRRKFDTFTKAAIKANKKTKKPQKKTRAGGKVESDEDIEEDAD